MRRLAAGRGIHILNVVRAAQRGDGPDIFLTDGDDLADRVIAIAGRQPKGALDAVAGTATGRLARCLAANGTLLVYGHLSCAPCEAPSRRLLEQPWAAVARVRAHAQTGRCSCRERGGTYGN